MARKSILIATGDSGAAEGIRECLGKDHRVDVAADWASCLDMFRHRRYEFTFIDVSLLQQDTLPNGRYNYKEALMPLWKAFPSADIIILAPQAKIREAVAAVKAGAGNYLTYPLDPHEVRYVTESLSELHRIESELSYLRDNSWRADVDEALRTNSPLMRDVLDKVKSVAPTRTTVLITGETGTGKGVTAKLAHSLSNRADRPFIAVHCGAIPDTLLESELFGHEKGAFTGAVRRKLGKFQIADGGTIFLDEIGTISAAAQIKLLQVLQERAFSRVGSDAAVEVDVRVVAATNMDLEKLCDDGAFRKDLFYRLNVFPINMPPLRDRGEDIPLLVETFLDRLAHMYNKDIRGVDHEVMDVLRRYPWPGNIRELENLVERAFILEHEPILTAQSFPSELFTQTTLGAFAEPEQVSTLAEVRQRAVDHAERRYLKDLLVLTKGRINQSAVLAGVTTRQFHNLLTRYGLRKEDYR